MKILIVAATRLEVQPFLDRFSVEEEQTKPRNTFVVGDHDVVVEVVGIGQIAMAWGITNAVIEVKPDIVINAGIAGTFNERDFPIGIVVNVKSETIADLGIEMDSDYKTIFEQNLMDEHGFPFKDGKLDNSTEINSLYLASLKKVKAITANTAHGKVESIEPILRKFDPDIESMEGAAFFYVMLKLGLPFAQIRSISNTIGPRKQQVWRLNDAVKALNEALQQIILDLK